MPELTIRYRLVSEPSEPFETLWKVKQNGAHKTFTLDSGDYVFLCEKKDHSEVKRIQELKGGHVMEVRVNLYKKRDYGGGARPKKPAIYLYSDQPVDMRMEVYPTSDFEFCYPKYEGGWDVHIAENGKLEVDGKPYDYLFWEGTMTALPEMNEGFIVQKEEVVTFLEDKLAHLGLNDREANDFITYWGPILVRNEYTKVSFIVNEQYNATIAGIRTDVPIDTEIRVFMAYEEVDGLLPIVEQELPTFQRRGLTLVEWGGGEVTDMKIEN